MSITLHWFLPTSGDGRTIVERFHANRWLHGHGQVGYPQFDRVARSSKKAVVDRGAGSRAARVASTGKSSKTKCARLI